MDRAKLNLEDSKSGQHDSAAIAESVNRDFGELVAIFSRHLEVGEYANGQDRSAILEARAAAEHGLRLSRQLLELLRLSSPQV
jgi:hypothetical protein